MKKHDTVFVHIPAVEEVSLFCQVLEVSEGEIVLSVINGGYELRLTVDNNPEGPGYNEAVAGFRNKTYG